MTRAQFQADWVATSDPYLLPQPYLDGATTFSGNEILITGEHLCALPSTSETHDFQIVDDSNGDVFTLGDEGDLIQQSGSVPGDVIMALGQVEAGPDGRAHSPFDFTGVRFISRGAGHSYKIHVPHAWQAIDVAQLIFAMTRFYTGAQGATLRDFLDQESFLDAHEYWENLYRRVAVCFFRRPEVKLGDDLVELAQATGAHLAFSMGDLDGIPRLRVFPEGVGSTFVPRSIDTGSTEDGVIGDVSVRWASELLRNRASKVPGPYTIYDTGEIRSRFAQTHRARDDENVAKQEDLGAQEDYGLLEDPRPLSAKWVPNRDHAHNSFDVYSGSRPLREVEFGQGPLALGYSAGDVVTITDPGRGLDGEEYVVVEQEIDLDTMTGAVRAIERPTPKIKGPEYVPGRLFTLDARTQPTDYGYSDGDPITAWDDSVSGDRICFNMSRGLGGTQNLSPTFRIDNGQHYVEFGFEQALDLSGITWDYYAADLGVRGWTCVAVLRQASTSVVDKDRCLIDIAEASTDLKLLCSTADGSGPAVRNVAHDIQDEIHQLLDEKFQIYAFRVGNGGVADSLFDTGRVHVLRWYPDGFTPSQFGPEALIDGKAGFFAQLTGSNVSLGSNFQATSQWLRADVMWVGFWLRDLNWPELRAIANWLREELF